MQREEADARAAAERERRRKEREAKREAERERRREELGEDYKSDEEEEEPMEEEEEEEEEEKEKGGEEVEEEEKPTGPSTMLAVLRHNDDQSKFWVSVGGYDAGYLYCCSLEGADSSYADYEAPQTIPVPSCAGKDIPLHSIAFK